MKKLIIFLIVTTIGSVFIFPICSADQQADVWKIDSGTNQVNLIELYSSEGCSSCPPAERWMTSLRDTRYKDTLWNVFVPVEFHVDYWNYLGWLDPFSRKAFSQRQYQYSHELGQSFTYTPGFVLNGRIWRDRSGFLTQGRNTGRLMVSLNSDHSYQIKFLPENATDDQYRIFGAFLGNQLKNIVTSGENSGRTLRHEFVVLNLQSSPLHKQGLDYTTSVKFTATDIEAESYSVAFWVTPDKSLIPLQSVGGDLPNK